ncbi:dihydropteroate synthase [Metabacillus iocasae]|uniref:Dihydropteroate synthase n=1 Tax=Priestia iocasae TaxID=2291674 RepID=A0ABS2QZI2_9BACI|nr:dihydropteroate synthase [Metabacillus iocasae]MBM7704889.1 dihydropteroate synthase [Metabacillus iocasae]
MIVKPLVDEQIITCGDYTLNYKNQTLIMGILNATPDSFSDGGKYNEIDQAIAHAKQMVEQGAHIIDVGGESTRPGAETVSEEEELERVIPVVRALSQHINVPISVDTYKAEVAKQAIEAGAHIINDVWGAKADPKMAEVAAFYGVPIILMHNRESRDYTDLIPDMISDLYESITIVKKAGVQDHQIILDPGIGFAKGMNENLEVMRNLDQFSTLGYPILLGTSRKSMIGKVLDLPPHERMEGTAATVGMGISKGIHITRVHDVLEISRFAKMMDVLVGKGEV